VTAYDVTLANSRQTQREDLACQLLCDLQVAPVTSTADSGCSPQLTRPWLRQRPSPIGCNGCKGRSLRARSVVDKHRRAVSQNQLRNTRPTQLPHGYPSTRETTTLPSHLVSAWCCTSRCNRCRAFETKAFLSSLHPTSSARGHQSRIQQRERGDDSPRCHSSPPLTLRSICTARRAQHL